MLDLPELPPTRDPARLIYTITEVAVLLNCSRPYIYQLLRAGRLNAIKMDKRTGITADELQRYVANLPAATYTPPRPKAPRTFLTR